MRSVKLFLIMFSCIFSIFSSPSYALNDVLGRGEVNMQGAIVDASCNITVSNRDQTIDMEEVPLIDIARNGQGNSKLFSIKLVNCILKKPLGNYPPGWKQFEITFDGVGEGDSFSVSGEASGVVLQITDKDGVIAKPGIPLPPQYVNSNDFQLDYTAKLVANNRALKSGGYFSSIHFKLDYF